MAIMEDADPQVLSFSQAQGYEEPPRLLDLEELGDDARRLLSDLFYTNIRTITGPFTIAHELEERWRAIALELHRYFWKRPLEDFSGSPRAFLNQCKNVVLSKDIPFNEVFDFLQMIMRHRQCPQEFISQVQKIFERCRLAYFIDTNGPPTILPMATRQEGVTIREAMETLNEAGLTGSETHLRKAAEFINQRDWQGSIRESIHAVESVAVGLAGGNANTLGAALKSLEKEHPLHPALRDGFSRLYGYTSDEKGIRHALVDKPDSPSGRDEALFMLGACASFASYLWRVSHGPNG